MEQLGVLPSMIPRLSVHYSHYCRRKYC